MALGVIRFVLKGWVQDLYLTPTFFFPYETFSWIAPLGPVGMYAVFAVMGLAALGIMLGWRYRLSAAAFFLLFTYVELIDKTNYLNHYYFVSLVSFLLVLLPAHRKWSLDVRRKPSLRADTVPAWTVNLLKFQLAVVYIFAGLAKLHPEWLLEAMPLKLWLPAHSHLPVIGPWLAEPWVAYVFSWAGAAYDLTIVFFLLWGRTRPLAYVAVIAFHLVTAALFPIGLFPYIMILLTLVFFPPEVHERILKAVGAKAGAVVRRPWCPSPPVGRAMACVLALYVLLQVVLPLRALTYPGDLFWHERGYRFSWRVMLMEKAGAATFTVVDRDTERRWEIANWEHLTPVQEKMMATQPDMILQFAHYLAEKYRAGGREQVEVYVDTRVTLNGRRSQPLVDPSVDLTGISDRGDPGWLLPLDHSVDRWVENTP